MGYETDIFWGWNVSFMHERPRIADELCLQRGVVTMVHQMGFRVGDKPSRTVFCIPAV